MSNYNPGIEPVPSDELPPDFPLPAVPELAEAEAWARGYAAKPEKERHREVRAILAEIDRLREGVPEVECPSCGATIRARMADAPVEHERNE